MSTRQAPPSSTVHLDLVDDEQLLYDLVDDVLGLAARLHGSLEAMLQDLGLSHSLANLVWQLDPRTPPMPMRRLARALNCDPSSITLLAARLEEHGFVERHPHPTDGRVKTLVLTRDGRRLRERMVSTVAAASPFVALSAREQKQLRNLLSRAVASDRSHRLGVR